MTYRGWDVWKDAQGVWRAQQYGVTACSNTKESLKRVLDHHIEDTLAYWKRINDEDDTRGQG